jgi:tRNA(fMet)-specific endonuclease VapC
MVVSACTVILLGRIDDAADLPDEAVISAITLAELSVGPHVAHSDQERAARQARLQQAESDSDVLVFDAESARTFGSVAASLRASSRKPAARAYDALIAVSAIAYDLPLYSCNPSDLGAIPRLDLRTVPTPITASHKPVERLLSKGRGIQRNTQRSTTAEQTCPFTQCLGRCHAEAALRAKATRSWRAASSAQPRLWASVLRAWMSAS